MTLSLFMVIVMSFNDITGLTNISDINTNMTFYPYDNKENEKVEISINRKEMVEKKQTHATASGGMIDLLSLLRKKISKLNI